MIDTYEDIRYELDGPGAVVTINRPERYNAFRAKTIEELIAALRAAWPERAVRCIILTARRGRETRSGDLVPVPPVRRSDR